MDTEPTGQHPVDYFEIGTADPAGSRAFYGGLFGWQVGPPSPQSYSTVDGGRGGLWDRSQEGEHWAVFYVRVPDVAAAVARAEELGGRVVVPVVDNGRITFAHLVDPEGNRFGVWRPNGAGGEAAGPEGGTA